LQLPLIKKNENYLGLSSPKALLSHCTGYPLLSFLALLQNPKKKDIRCYPASHQLWIINRL